jgi:muramoyltetrapeptide carboxypeptidase
MIRPRALRPGDRIAVVAPASGLPREELNAGMLELRTLGFDPVCDERVLERRSYVAGSATLRAAVWSDAWRDPAVQALVAARGGYGSVQLLPLLESLDVARTPKIFQAYSDNTSILTWLTLQKGIVSFHGPMIDRRFSRGVEGYDPDTFTRVVCEARPAGEISHPAVEVLKTGDAAGMLIGGTLTQLVGSLGTPFAFDPPPAHVLFIDEVAERPYRVDRMFTQLRQSGLLARAAALVFGELPRCDEPGGDPAIRAVVADLVADFPGPVLFGLPSGHSAGPTLTIPFGVRARVVAAPDRPVLVIEEAAVS